MSCEVVMEKVQVQFAAIVELEGEIDAEGIAIGEITAEAPVVVD